MTRASSHVFCFGVLGNYTQFVFISQVGICTYLLYVFSVLFPHVCVMCTFWLLTNTPNILFTNIKKEKMSGRRFFIYLFFLKYLNGIGWRSPASCNGAVRVKITSGIHHFKVATHRKLLSLADHIEVMRPYPLHRGVNNWIGMRWAGVVRNFQSRNSSKHKIFALN